MLDLSDDEGDEAIEDATAPKTAEEKAQQQFQLVESFGSEKQKRLLASARQSKVDGTDLDLANSLPMVDTQCKIIIKKCYTTNCIYIVSVELLPYKASACWTPVKPSYCPSQFSVSNLQALWHREELVMST